MTPFTSLNPLALLVVLIIGHCLCDYPLQGDFLAKAKNHIAPIPGVPWYQALAAHSIIQGGMVWFVTGLWQLGLAECVAHALIDWWKSQMGYRSALIVISKDELRTFNERAYDVDQLLHLMCKVLWVWFVAAGIFQ